MQDGGVDMKRSAGVGRRDEDKREEKSEDMGTNV